MENNIQNTNVNKELKFNFIAHKSENEEERLIDHLNKVSQKCSKFASIFNQSEIAKIIGLFHDLGKYSLEFQDRIRGSNKRVDHSTAGAQYVKNLYKFDGGFIYSTIMAFCIMGHHGGIPDKGTINDTDEEPTLEGRFKKKVPYFENFSNEIQGNLINFNQQELYQYLLNNKTNLGFSLSFLTRMIYSCLVDADFLETEKFISPFTKREITYDFSEMRNKLDEKIKSFEKLTGTINEKRREIVETCLEKANSKKGIYSLTVPTGGGKTISSMVFALNHLLKHDLKRIIYVIPYSSIIEQNAFVFKQIFGEEKIVEHHYSFDYDLDDNYNLLDKEAKMKLATENWDAPIIVTTNVQFFESLFSNKPSKCRKIHNIANSIIVFDEVQMFPYDFMKPILKSIEELVKNFGCSILLSSATQPAFQKQLSNIEIQEIVNNPKDLNSVFKRVKIQKMGEVSNDDISKKMNQEKQVLTIVNERKMALSIFNKLNNKRDSFCLSTLLTPFDRKKNIKAMKEKLKFGKRCRVVSTQLIEAGVDIDFPLVYRAMAGMDSIIQSAGRCNREGRLDEGQVFIFKPKDKSLRRDFNFLDQAEKITEWVFEKFADVLSLEAVEYYFNYSYEMSNLDKNEIMKMFYLGNKYDLNFSFSEAASKMKLINNFQKQIIIENEHSKQAIEQLKYSENYSGLFRKLQQHSVMIYQFEFEKLKKDKKIHEILPNIYVLNDFTIYSSKTGLNVFYEDDLPLLNG